VVQLAISRQCGFASGLSDLRSPDVLGGLAKAKPRGLLRIDRGRVETLLSQRGLIKPSKRAGADQPQRSRRPVMAQSMPVHRIGELRSDQESPEARPAVRPPLEA